MCPTEAHLGASSKETSMTATIEQLPWEILNFILQHAVRLNYEDNATFSYGLTGATRPTDKARLARYVRGHIPPDVQRWNAATAIRQTSSAWHIWAAEFSLDELYIRRWRGSERWLEARYLTECNASPSGIAVYRDPFCSLRKTVRLFSDFPTLAACVRRIWFDGFYVAETTEAIFDILSHCSCLRAATLPWTTMRHGTAKQWSTILGSGPCKYAVASLELLAVDLKQAQIASAVDQLGRILISSPNLDLGNLTRLKIYGNTNYSPITDNDLDLMARTAVKLQELHITGNASISINGVMALVKASNETLRVLQYSPLSNDGFEHPLPQVVSPNDHICESLLACQQLSDVSISLPSLCPTLFSRPDVRWSEEVQIRFAGFCCSRQASSDCLGDVLDKARSLIEVRAAQGMNLSIELFTSHWIYEAAAGRVHGNFDEAHILSGGTWPSAKHASGKGPYGQTGLYGKDEGPYSWITDFCFAEGLEKGYVFCL